jgi:hypothetical protein
MGCFLQRKLFKSATKEKKMRRILASLLSLILVSCAALQPDPQPTSTPSAPYIIRQEENPYAPQAEDFNKKEDGVILTSIDFSERYDMNPIRAELHVLGSMPSVCSELRIKISPPNELYQIHVEIYSIAALNLKCENVFQQFEASLLLGEYSPGQYTVWVNDRLSGSIASY